MDSPPQQLELPLAWVKGEPITQLPKNLYIPPKALKVLLTSFEGPLDLLSYLIRVNRFDIADIPVVEVTRQYQAYLAMMQELDMALAAEYLYMAAWLTEIKSRLLLPKSFVDEESELEDDPREALMQQLLNYQALQYSAEWLSEQVAKSQADYPVMLAVEDSPLLTADEQNKPGLDLAQIMQGLLNVYARQALVKPHQVGEDKLRISHKMDWLVQRLSSEPSRRFSFIDLVERQEGKPGLVITFIALLELWRQQKVSLFPQENLEFFGVQRAS